MLRVLAVALVSFLFAAPRVSAAPVLDFETIGDLEPVTSQFAGIGVTFENAIGLVDSSVGGSLLVDEFPTASGVTVIGDDIGPMRLIFSSLMSSFGGFFTYSEPLVLEAYKSGALVGQTNSAFGANVVSSGNAPNEFLTLAGIFDEVLITGGAFGGSFTADDLTFQTANGVVPEPATVSLLALGAAAGLVRRRRTLKR